MATLLTVAVLAVLSRVRTAHAAPTYDIGRAVDRFPSSVAQCIEYTIPITVTSQNYIFNITKLEDDFDTIDLVTNYSRKDTNTTVFNPVAGAKNITATYTISGTFCSPKNSSGPREKTVLLATHGLHYDGRYWDSAYKPEEYSFAEALVKEGYSVFYYDRLGTGKSQKVSGYTNQGTIQIEIIASLSTLLRTGHYTGPIGSATSIVLVGHSFGSFTSSNVVSKYPFHADAILLTGIAYGGLPWGLKILLEGFAPRIAAQLYPSCFGALDTGYLTFADIYAHVGTFFKAPFERAAALYAQSIVQPFAIAEWLSLAPGLASPVALEFKGPVYVTTGEFDFPACTGECYSTFKEAEPNMPFIFPKSRKIESAVHPGAGHGINFGLNATGFYSSITEFLKREGF